MKKALENTRVQGLSADIQLERLEALRELLPEAFSEGKLDAEKIRKIFDTEVLAGNEEGERFRLEWAGKGKVFDEIARRTSCTLALDEKRSSKDFQNSQNVFIEGENLEVLRILQKAYHGKVKMIYIDPPYNTGHDFVYNDDFRQTEEEYNEDFCNLDENGNIKRAYTKNSKDSGRYHSNWLSMMYPRLYLSRNLLKDDGVIFVSIDDNEVHNLRAIMNEIFGEENFVGVLKRRAARKTAHLSGSMSDLCDYIVVYSKQGLSSPLSVSKSEDPTRPVLNRGNKEVERIIRIGTEARCKEQVYPVGEYEVKSVKFRLLDELVVSNGTVQNEVRVSGPFRVKQELLDKTLYVTRNFGLRRYVLPEELEADKTMHDLVDNPEFYNEKGTEIIQHYFGNEIVFDTVKPVNLLKLLINASLSGDEHKESPIILDFFSGSGTTADAVIAQNAEDGGNRRYICVQMPETTPEDSEARKAGYTKISDIAIDRIRKAAEKIRNEHPEYSGDLGVRVYTETDSNFPQWHSRSFGSDEQLTGSLLEYANRMPTGDEQARVTEVLLKLGYPLTATIEQKEGFSIVDGSVALVLNDTYEAEKLSKIFEVEPSTVVVLERVFKDDSQKINFALRCKEAKIIFQTI